MKAPRKQAVRTVFLALLAALPVAISCIPAQGHDTTGPRPLFDYTVRSFGPREGAPSQVMGMAQTPDGFLWLASSQGLIRFDGVHFVPEDKVKAFVTAIASDSDGALWLGYEFGGIGRFKGGRYDDLGQGYPRHTTWMIVPDDVGGIWTLTSVGVYWHSHGRWVHVGASEGLPADATPRHIGKLADGSIWITGPQGSNRAWRRGPNDARFVAIEMRDLWWPLFGVHPKDVSTGLARTLDSMLGSILVSFDQVRPGEVWHVVDDLGRMRLGAPTPGRDGALTDDVFHLESHANGLTSVQHDREGNIWLGDTDGIIRLSPARLHAVAPRKALMGPVFASSSAGDVWLGANGGGPIYHATATGLSLWREKTTSVVGFVADPDSVWIVNGGDAALKGTGAIEHVRLDGSPTPEPPPPKLDRPVFVVTRIPGGGILAATPAGFIRYAEGRWSLTSGIEGLPASAPLRLASSAAGQLWLGYPDGDVIRVDGSAIHRFSSDHLALGAIYAIAPGAQHTWIGGDAGIAAIVGDRAITQTNHADSRFAGVRGVLETSSGELWINAAHGVYQITKAGVDALLRGESPGSDSVALFDEDDGLQGGIVAINAATTLAEGADGKIWMSRLDGATWFDPATARRNGVPAQAFIESVSADGHALSPTGSIAIPAGTRRLDVAFTAPSLSRPDRVTFRYRLVGADADWVDAGTRRSASYAGLSPGRYAFEVRAFNEDGVGVATPASIALTLEPTLTQTWWFRAVGVLALLGMLLALYAVRIRIVRERLRLQHAARHDERDRIARELHDTLLQSMHGLALKVHTWSDAGDLGSAEQKQDMRRVAETARLAVRDSRIRILELRSSTARSGLLDGLLLTVNNLAAGCAQNFDVSEAGRVRPVSETVLDEVLAVASEAMRNAGRHSGGSTITVGVRHTFSALIVTVSDDGAGFPVHILSEGRTAGHWGLVGMHERAQRIGARLHVENMPNRGAQVRLVVPARRAYGRRGLKDWFDTTG